MAYTTKGKSNQSAHVDAHGSAAINYRHVKNKGTASVRGGQVVTDSNGDELAMTMICDADQTVNNTPGANAYQSGVVWVARAVVVATGTANLSLYDNNGGGTNTPSATGTLLGVIPSSATLGQKFDIQMPVSQGGISIMSPAGAVQVALAFA